MPTRAAYRAAVAKLLGMHETGTASAGANNTAAQLEASGSSENGLRWRSSVLPAGELRDKWLFRPAATAPGDADRLIADYEPALGFLTPDDPWTNPPASEPFEVLGLFSAAETHALIDEALARCLVVVEITFTVADPQLRRHDLGVVAPWLHDWRWVHQVGVLAPTESRDRVDPFGRRITGTARTEDGRVVLEGPTFAVTDTVYVRLIKAARDHCRASGGEYGDQIGLLRETDEAPVGADWVAWGAVVAAQDRLDRLIETGVATQAAQRTRAAAAARFSEETRRAFTAPERTYRPLTWYGPTRELSWAR